jgi:HK97 family phage major capsid protein
MNPKTKTLREERAALLDSMSKRLTDAHSQNRPMTDEETSAHKADDARADALKVQIEAIEKVDAEIEASRQLIPNGAKPAQPKPTPEPEPRTQPYVTAPVFASQLRSFKGQDAEKRAHRSGMWIKAILGDQFAGQWCRDNGVRIGGSGEVRAMGESVNSAGGFLVPEEFSSAIIAIRDQYGVFRQNARVLNMSTDTIMVPRRTSGLSVYALGENPSSEITKSDIGLDQVRLTAKNWATHTDVSNDLLADSAINVADLLAAEWGYAYALKEDQCGFTGDASATYQGILGVNNKYEANTSFLGWTTAATAAHDTIAELDLGDVMPLVGKVMPQFLGRSKWYMSSTTWGRIAYLLANAGGNTIGTLQGGSVGMSFYGFPVVISNVLPTASATDYTNKTLALFGDLSAAATIGSRQQLSVLVDPYTRGGYNQTRFVSVSRWDINVHDIGSASVYPPLAALAGGTS